MSVKNLIAKRVAEELNKGDLVNLGIGMPTSVADFVPAEKHVVFQSENGMVGLDATPEEGKEDWDLTNAGGTPVTAVEGAAYFDSTLSFSLIRGGHVDATVLGAMEVDREGNLANYMIPKKMVAGMGGAMDLVSGAKRVIIMMTHCNKNGEPKILDACTLPLTALKCVDLIVTELAVIEPTEEGLVLREVAFNTSVEEVLKKTGTELIVPENVKVFGE
ncbi:3-oxoacid CoA-transferase subunit B [Reinekea marinisedimentorum]|uniref:Acetate CoA/acetoacetate CoA-transferase beta subunit n=1 Tax=Reinekea marinisedimentorum TaxID=230495 RepID=A0A4V2UJQ4_9GAMM|nr:3-oxoacid CoA-transferase subunit B [Reinekea marinisedimentorum]TCS41086.1 acetate CoA/acetoacetate CoA-transferase beta subunit [Reinekea marinisedimentorum]